MKVLFMGTPDFSLACLDWLWKNTQLCGVVTQPDKPKGRGHKLLPPPVKQYAAEREIPVFQPQTLKGEEFYRLLSSLQPELIVVVAYGKLLPEQVLSYPKYGCINVHASLLPRWRGAAPIQRAVMAGDTVTGVTTMQMEKGLDTGPMLLRRELVITPEDTGGTVHDRLSLLGVEVLAETVRRLGSIQPQPQPEEGATYASMITKDTCKIHWDQTAQELCNQVRGLAPAPLAFTRYQGKTVKIGRITPGAFQLAPGEIGAYQREYGLPVGCKDGSVWVEELKPEGKKMMSIHDFVRGNSFAEGSFFETE